MIVKIAEYTIQEAALDNVLIAIAEFVKEIHAHEPETFYEAYRRQDTLEFIHLMKFPDSNSERAHQQASYTKRFVDILYPVCTKQPMFTDLQELEK